MQQECYCPEPQLTKWSIATVPRETELHGHFVSYSTVLVYHIGVGQGPNGDLC